MVVRGWDTEINLIRWQEHPVLFGRHPEHVRVSGTRTELVHASEWELARYDLVLTDFPLVRTDPSLVATSKLASLGWDSTPSAEALSETVEEHLASRRTG